MKRRVMIAKALSHEPDILFLDEPSAGVDVELRRDMWEVVRKLRSGGATIILTTHYIEEAEEMADRVGVISHGELIADRREAGADGADGQEDAEVVLADPIDAVPDALADWDLALADDGHVLHYQFDRHAERTGIASLMRGSADLGIGFKDLSTRESSLEDIFVEPDPQPEDARRDEPAMASRRSTASKWRGPAAPCGRAWSRRSSPPRSTSSSSARPSAAACRHERGPFRQLHRPRPDPAVGVHAVDLQRQLRHLFSQVHRDHLRAAVGADLEPRERSSPMSARRSPNRWSWR